MRSTGPELPPRTGQHQTPRPGTPPSQERIRRDSAEQGNRRDAHPQTHAPPPPPPPYPSKSGTTPNRNTNPSAPRRPQTAQREQVHPNANASANAYAKPEFIPETLNPPPDWEGGPPPKHKAGRETCGTCTRRKPVCTHCGHALPPWQVRQIEEQRAIDYE